MGPILVGFLCSFFICLALVFTKGWHGTLTFDSSSGVQKNHSEDTPRVGGLAVFLGTALASTYLESEANHLMILMLLAGTPAFLFGSLEDITKRVGVLTRLLATMASGALAWHLTGYSLTRLDLGVVDQCLKFVPLSVLVTAFAVGGVANALNIIDGFNGLASSSSIFAFVGLALIAHAVGDTSLAVVALLLAATVAGLFVVNWPLGKIFLGDGGAYFIGFCLAWLCVLLSEEHSNVTAFVALLMCVHPVTEVLFSVYRRLLRKVHPGHPDRLHLHSIFKARYVRRWFPGRTQATHNSIAGLLMGGVTLVPVTIAQFTYASTRWSLIAVVALVLTYILIYIRMVSFRWRNALRLFAGCTER
jgi:UDP-N-acetylmuramyl pentapeptide phosphotransferase/UDP-N-acetylglucosamine-1-phosphate transferase